MYSEYLFNNDTQEISNRVCELASSNEPALRAHCQEVSRQTDTSSLALQEDCIAKLNAAKAILQEISVLAEELSKALTRDGDVFGVQNGQAVFPAVCRAVVQTEERRLSLVSCISQLTQVRRKVASSVAEANRALHVLSLAKCAAGEDVKEDYAQMIQCTNLSYERLKALDFAVCEMQTFCMTLVESHLSVFMQRMRAAGDFNHGGKELDCGEIRLLCRELKILINRAPNITF